MLQENARPPTERKRLPATWYTHALSMRSHNNAYIRNDTYVTHVLLPDASLSLYSPGLLLCSFYCASVAKIWNFVENVHDVVKFLPPLNYYCYASTKRHLCQKNREKPVSIVALDKYI